MQIKTILNRVQKFKSFVYGSERWVEDAPVPTLEVEIQPRLNSRPEYSGCGHKGPGYDQSPQRLFVFIPMCCVGAQKSYDNYNRPRSNGSW